MLDITADSSKKGAYDFSDVMRTNDIDNIIYDVTLENVQHVSQTLQQNTGTFIF